MCHWMLPAVCASAIGAAASAAWVDRPGSFTPDEITSSLAALGLEGDRLVRATLGADGAIDIDAPRSHGDALSVDLRVNGDDLIEAVYHRLTGAPLPDDFTPEELASMLDWALSDPDRFLAEGGTMNELRRARREAARRALEDPRSLAARQREQAAELRPAGEARPVDFEFEPQSNSRAVPAPSSLAPLAALGLVIRRRRR